MNTEHNPDGLTPEQYGAPEWRLLTKAERINNGDEYWCNGWFRSIVGWRSGPPVNQAQHTYRRRVSPPSPETDATAERTKSADAATVGQAATEPPTHLIQIRICQPCLDGVGKECHTPECALFLHRVDLPIMRDLYKIVDAAPANTAAECAAEGCLECSRLRAELAEARRDRDRCRLWIHGKVQYLRGLDNKWGYTLTGDGPLYETADQAIDAVVSQPEAKEGQ